MSSPSDQRPSESPGGSDPVQRDLLDGWLAVVADSQRLTHLLRAAADEAPPRVKRELELVLEHLNRATGHDRSVPDDPRLLAWLPALIHSVRTNQPLSAVRAIAADSSPQRQPNDGDGSGRSTGLYLLSLVGVAWAVALLISEWILPTFVKLFGEFGIELPAITMLLLRVGAVLRSPVVQIVILSVLGTWLWATLAPRSRVGRWIRAFAPGLRRVARAKTWSRSSENLALLIEAGYDWPTARRLAAQASGCAEQGALSGWVSGPMIGPVPGPGSVRAAKTTENDLPTAESESWVTPTSRWAEVLDRPAQVQIDVLRTMAAIYGDLAIVRRHRLTSLIGPLGIVLVGMLVGLTVIGLFAPLISLIQNLS
ncbi:MAG: hypothetical protein U0795_09140 [Pirellulales bacterium]